MSFNINRPNSFKLSSLPKLHQPNLFALYHFDTKNLYKIQTKYTYSRDKQSPFTPDSITNISPHSIIVSSHLLITRHQTDRRSSNLIKTSSPLHSRHSVSFCQTCVQTTREHSPSSSMPGLRSLSPHEIRHSPGDVRSRRVCVSTIVAKRRLSRFFVPSRPVSKDGRSVSQARYRIMPRSQQWLHLNSGRSSFVTIPGIGETWDPCVHRENGENRQQAEVTQESKLVFTLYTCIFQYFFSFYLFFFARFSFPFCVRFFRRFFNVLLTNVFTSCWDHVNVDDTWKVWLFWSVCEDIDVWIETVLDLNSF